MEINSQFRVHRKGNVTLHPCRTRRNREQGVFLPAFKSVANCQRGLRADLEYVRSVAVQLTRQKKQLNMKNS